MDNDDRLITRADRQVLKSLARNLVVGAVFAVCAVGSQWFWQLLIEPGTWVEKTVTISSQIAFGLGAACHAIAGVIVVVNHSIRDAVNQIRQRRE